MPNLDYLCLVLHDTTGGPGGPLPSGNDVMLLFYALSKMMHLETVRLTIQVEGCELKGEWLLQLGTMKKLAPPWLRFDFSSGTLSIKVVVL
jgi:hypothetical protein